MKPAAADNRLHVEGSILDKRETQPLTHLGGTMAPVEASFELAIDRAWLTDGTAQNPMMVFPSTFAGERSLLDDFQVGERVRITCTTASSRLIAAIERLSAATDGGVDPA